ncbi:hypothetical protein ALI144C_00430 [Actinosynnema sp. ALI-1.44]|uniref:STAS domain-containing protein n=1 Tax=Actinosynnema sp. ALI-1.44 TaxID=1933779 RepID=UPI0009CF0C66|nr:STAS domain-containing protein [Actinosynnema sp. ALI-1.44]ONI91883.1 hypothetical protein ALI144C_00430 [Actinosynnema sp. ALI-1.44]
MAVTSEAYDEDIIVLRVLGEVTTESTPTIDLDVRRVCRSDPTVLLVDLTGVTFFGAAGLTLLLDIYRRTELSGTALSLVASPRIVRLLVITDLARIFDVRGTLRHAVNAARDVLANVPWQDLAAATPPSGAGSRRRLLRPVPD